MWQYLLVSAVLGAALAQSLGGATAGAGGASRHNGTGDASHVRTFNTTGGNATHHAVDPNLGVCYREVPTASIAKDPKNVPAGNGSTPALSRIRACCPGYAPHPHLARRCVPVCTRACVNALCTAPDTCTCLPGHARNLGGHCVPTCPAGCQHGACAGGECICEPGYRLDAGGAFCRPTCAENCGGHGNCTAPDTCACDREYRAGAGGACIASCAGCEHGDCVGPSTCVCHKGYTKSQHGDCVPVCSKGCTNGACVAPEVCTCQYGFQLDEAVGICQPKCLTPCINSLCTGPDTCTCKPGYIRDKSNPLGNVCAPHCAGGCENGVCSGPNFCICNFGFVKDRSVKGSQTCVKAPARNARQAPYSDVEKLISFNIPE